MSDDRYRALRARSESRLTMASIDALIATWEARRAEGARLKALVPLEVIAADVVEALRELQAADAGELLTLEEAAERSGYSTDHLSRLIRQGTLPNAGRRHAPRLRAADLPRKAGPLPSGAATGIVASTREQIAQSVRDRFRSDGHG